MVVVPSLLTLNLEVFCAHGLFSSVECKFFWHILNRKKKKQQQQQKTKQENEIIAKHGLNCSSDVSRVLLHKFQTQKRANHSKTACNKIGCILKERKCQQLGFFQRYARLFRVHHNLSSPTSFSQDFICFFFLSIGLSNCDCSLVMLNLYQSNNGAK